MLAIINAKIYPVVGDVTEDGVILIEDGRILNLGAGLPVPDGAEVVDACGLPVTPGLIEAHGHVGLIDAGLGPPGVDVNEVTDPVTSHVRALDGINPEEGGFGDFLGGGVTTVQVLPGSANVLGGMAVTIKTRPASVVDEVVLKEYSGMKAALGENPKRAHGRDKDRAPATRMGTVAIMREWLMKAREYAEGRENGGGGGEHDARLEALVPVIRGEVPLRIHCHRADDIVKAIEIAEEFGVDYTIEHTTQGFKLAELLAEKGVSCAVGPCMSSESKVELEGVGYETPVALHRAGARFCLTTDHPVVRALYLHMMAGVASAHGVGDEAALRSVTLGAAEHIGVADRVGSLQKGKDADVVVWNGDPLDARSSPRLVIIDGEVVYPRASD